MADRIKRNPRTSSNKINPFNSTKEAPSTQAPRKSMLFDANAESRPSHKFNPELSMAFARSLSKEPEITVEEEEAVVVTAPKLSRATDEAVHNLKPALPSRKRLNSPVVPEYREDSSLIPESIGELSDKDDPTGYDDNQDPILKDQDILYIPGKPVKLKEREWINMEIKETKESKNQAQIRRERRAQKEIADSKDIVEATEQDPNGDTEPKEPEAPKEPEFDKEDILPLMDSLLQNGYATDSFKLRKTAVVFRTRFGWEEKMVLKTVEQSPSTSAVGYQRELNMCLMAASLIQFGDDVFDPINEGDKEDLEQSFQDRYDFIASLNNVFIDIMQKKLAVFDAKQKYLIDHFDEFMEAF